MAGANERARAPKGALERCVGEPRRDFLASSWAQRAVLRRAVDGGRYRDLLSDDDFDRLVSSSSLQWPSLRLVHGERTISVEDYTRTEAFFGSELDNFVDPGLVWSAFHEGATIVLQGLEHLWQPIGDFARALELDLTFPVRINAYLTPPLSQGLPVHYDDHDVFVLQLSGSKHWRVYERAVEAPLRDAEPLALRPTEGPHIDEVVRPGDCLYMPAGFLHEAKSVAERSLHLTVGVLTFSWADLLRELLNTLSQEIEFRKPLPPGFATHPSLLADEWPRYAALITDRLAGLSAPSAAAELGGAFRRQLGPRLHGQLGQLERLSTLTQASKLRRRPLVLTSLRRGVDDDVIVLDFDDRALELPVEVEASVARAISGEPFAVGDLVELTSESRVVLVRRLVVEGICEFL
jgi:bifunctional lysine-specific demethylase and histidyl-hydroxylase NO66